MVFLMGVLKMIGCLFKKLSKSIRNPSKSVLFFSKSFKICTRFFKIGLLNSKSAPMVLKPENRLFILHIHSVYH